MYILGSNYFFGSGGIPKDLEKAVYWLTAAAEREDEEAMDLLGFCYENGLGVEEDEDAALYWYRCAADCGSKAAAERLKERQDDE